MQASKKKQFQLSNKTQISDRQFTHKVQSNLPNLLKIGIRSGIVEVSIRMVFSGFDIISLFDFRRSCLGFDS